MAGGTDTGARRLLLRGPDRRARRRRGGSDGAARDPLGRDADADDRPRRVAARSRRRCSGRPREGRGRGRHRAASARRSRSGSSPPGIEVVIGSRDAARAREAAEPLGAEGATNEDAVRGVDLVAARGQVGRGRRDRRASCAARSGRRRCSRSCAELSFGPGGVKPTPEATSIAERIAGRARRAGRRRPPLARRREPRRRAAGRGRARLRRRPRREGARARSRRAARLRPRPRRRPARERPRARGDDRRDREREQALQGARGLPRHRPAVTVSRELPRLRARGHPGDRAPATTSPRCSPRRRSARAGSRTATSSSSRRRSSPRPKAAIVAARRDRRPRSGRASSPPTATRATSRRSSRDRADRPLAAAARDRRDAARLRLRLGRRRRLEREGRRHASILLPLDPDASAARIRAALRERTGADVGVIVSDSFGRAWRQGTTDVALGVAGVTAVLDLSGRRDAAGYELAGDADRGRRRARGRRGARARQARAASRRR